MNSEPLWLPYLPSEKAVCDYRIRFALNNCIESDPPISVYSSDALLDDQLEMQMNLFLSDSVYVDLCEDSLYLPSFLIDQFSLFLPNNRDNKTLMTHSQTSATDVQQSFQSDLENLIRFLIEHVSEELSEQLKGLLELDSIEGFGGGENLDEFGRRILSFPIHLIPKSDKFSLFIDYYYQINKQNNKFFTNATITQSGSWYRRKILNIIRLNELNKKCKRAQSETNEKTASDGGDIEVSTKKDTEEKSATDDSKNKGNFEVIHKLTISIIGHSSY